jgi:hypothetical protein
MLGLLGAIFGLGCCAPAIPAKQKRIASITLDRFMGLPPKLKMFSRVGL